jgi:lipopolysaccharide transport system ATP-binding protein
MSNFAIRVEDVKKQYILGKRQDRHDTLRDALISTVQAPVRYVSNILRRSNDGRASEKEQRTLRALDGLSFEIPVGQVVGIIGHNGAGKSTLLKILSRITEPSSGRAIVCGRVGSLLEVGTGFHPELSGRENIFLNGAILGMSRSEIYRKFDEIVTFAEIEKFLDTPVKRYSSGMYVRLAFAVAAHLETEILLVDEVLAVGDANFQKKCLGKMDDVASEGRTILFVSHNMNAIQRLCPQSVLLKDGKLQQYGKTSDVVAGYLSSDSFAFKPCTTIELSTAGRSGTQEAHFKSVQFTSKNEKASFRPYENGPLEFSLEIDSNRARSVGSIAVTLYDLYGTKLINADTLSLGETIRLHAGINHMRFNIEQLFLKPGIYVLGLWMANPEGEVFDQINGAIKIEVVDLESEGLGNRPRADGLVSCDFRVEVV